MSHCRRGHRARRVCLLLALMLLVSSFPSGAVAAPPPSGEVSNEPITASKLLSGAAPDSLTANARFAPPEGARRAGQPFIGTLRLDGAPMTMLAGDHRGQVKSDGFTSNPILGKDTTFFPDVSLSFFTHKGHLVPTTQDVVRNGVLPGTRSWWDIIVQPGRVWSEPGDPMGWNRAAFPFALVNEFDNETHTGVALFLYRGSQVSPVRFQVVQQGAPWLVEDYFTAWGVTEAGYRPGDIDNLGQRMLAYEEDLADRLPVKPWSAMPEEVTSDPLVQASFTQPSFDADPDGIAAAVVLDGVLYRTGCQTAAGPFPYCDEMRFGMWSVAKSAMLNVATLRVAQKYGAGILNEPIADYLPAARRPSWDDVTFRDLTNMSSGHTLSAEGYYSPEYNCWLQSRTEDEKTETALSLFPRTYQPGAEFHYQDQDTYLLGVALDALLKSKEGPEASAWKMLKHEVYRPIRIHHLSNTFTTEEDGSRGQPWWNQGYFATLDDLAKLALLYQNHGAWDGHQILHRGLVDTLLPTTTQPPQDRSPDPAYYMNWWIRNVDSWWVAYMLGWGDNRVTLLPRDQVTIQIANFIGPSIWPPEDFVPEWPVPDPCDADGANG